MSRVDNSLIFVRTNGFNFLCIFMALQIERLLWVFFLFCFVFFFLVNFMFEELEEFSKEEAFVRRNLMFPLEI